MSRPTVPAQCVGPSLCESPRGNQEPLNLINLRLTPPREYQLGPGDVLAIYIEGLQGAREAAPAVLMPQQPGLLPAIGFPVPVHENGTVSLPLIGSIPVEGMTLLELEQRLREEYTVKKHFIPADRVFSVSLFRRRIFRVLVVREDRATPMATYTPGQIVPEPMKVGQAQSLELPAYENDVLHALVNTGGLPGVTAKNEVIILRGVARNPEEMKKLMIQLQDRKDRDAAIAQLPAVTRIPLRIPIGVEPPPLAAEDIILGDGDVVMIESREAEVFYTGGVIRGGQFPLPRDYDLDVLGAIAMAGGSVGTAGGTATSAGVVIAKGGGIFPPTRLTVVRFQNGHQVPIRVDLNRALTDPRERILIQPNDFILLEYTVPEVIGNLIVNEVFVSFSFTKSLD